MKRFICLLLCALALCVLPACHYGEGGDIQEPVEFHYPRKSDSFLYGSESSVFGSEIREATGHRNDLNYLLSMYLRGPQDSHLRSLIPDGCRLIGVWSEENTVCVVLTGEFTQLENAEQTLACAALAQTCLGLTDAEFVRIESTSAAKTFSITLDAGIMLLSDSTAFDAALKTEAP